MTFRRASLKNTLEPSLVFLFFCFYRKMESRIICTVLTHPFFLPP